MIPIWIKLAYTALAVVVAAVYAVKYKPSNFLWFSDIALLAMVPALWLESTLIASMMAVAVLLPEAFWTISFFLRLLTGRRLSGLTDYMFEAERPLYLRALSLFHLALPPLLLYAVIRLGYDARAPLYQTLLAWIVLPVTYFFADPEKNVNWVRGPAGPGGGRFPDAAYLPIAMVAFPLAVYLPTHLLLTYLIS